jgi:chromosome segregation ATPase
MWEGLKIPLPFPIASNFDPRNSPEFLKANMASRSKGGEGQASEMFPDIHHKMSKKIAQLTKVIYHLNTKNEDHETELSHVADAYELEIDDILKEASNKIQGFKMALEQQQEQKKASQMLAEMQERHAAEQDKALKDLEKLKKEYSEREKQLLTTSNNKIQRLTQDIEDMRGEFEKRMTQFVEKNKEYEKSASSSAESIKRAHAIELESLVTSSNEKYNAMLAERIKAEEELFNEMNEGFKKRDQMLAENEKKLADKVQDCDNLKQELSKIKADLDALRAQNSSEIQAWREKLVVSETAYSKASDEKESFARLNEALTREKVDLQGEVSSLKNQIIGLQAEIASANMNAGEKNTALQMELKSRDAHISSLMEQLESMKTVLESKSRTIETLRSDKDLLDQKLTALSVSLENESGALTMQLQERDETIGKLSDALESSMEKAREFEEANAQLQKAVDTSNEMLQARIIEQSKMKKELEATHAKAMEEWEAKWAEAQQKWENDLAGTSEEADRVRAEAAERLQQQHATQLSEMEQAHALALEALQAKAQEDMTKLRMTLAALEGEKDEALQQISDLKETAAKDASEALRRETAKLTEAQEALAEAKRAHTAELQAVSSELSESHASNKMLEAELRSLERRLQSSQDETSDALAKLTQAQKEIMEVKDMHSSFSKSSQEDFERRIASLNQQIADDRADAQLRHESNLEMLRKEKALEMRQALDQLAREKDEERRQLEMRLNEEVAKLQRMLDANNAMLMDGKSSMEMLAQKHEDEMAELNRKSSAIAEGLRAEMERGMQSLKDTLSREHQAVLEQLKTTHLSEVENARSKNERERQELMHQHAEEMENARRKAGEAMEEALEKAATQQHSALAQASKEAEEKRQAELKDLTLAKDEELAARGETIRLLERDLSQKTSDVDALTKGEAELMLEIGQLKNILAGKDGELMSIRTDLMDRMNRMERELTAKHEAEVRSINEENLIETQSLNAEFQRAQHLMEERTEMLERRLGELQHRYENRESRPEDLMRIQELMEDCEQKEIMVQKTIEEMKYFKLELLNREDSFNKKFGGSPNVGVMNVVKPKQAGSMKTSASNSKLPPLGTAGSSGLGASRPISATRKNSNSYGSSDRHRM